jgi:hypothetical protein
MARLVHPKPSAHVTTIDRVCDTLEDVAFVLMLVSGVVAVVAIVVLVVAL